jgi:uncharacterized membrane protein YgcG
MDNLVFRFLLEYWPVLIAIAITLLLVYQYLRPKLSAEDLQKGVIQQGVLKALQKQEEDKPSAIEEGVEDEWRESLQKVRQLLPNMGVKNTNVKVKQKYQTYITISLIWVLVWIGATAFITTRIILDPYYYSGEAVFLGYFAYYILIGLISYYRR